MPHASFALRLATCSTTLYTAYLALGIEVRSSKLTSASFFVSGLVHWLTTHKYGHT